MVVQGNFLKSQDSISTFENNLTSIFLSSDQSKKKPVCHDGPCRNQVLQACSLVLLAIPKEQSDTPKFVYAFEFNNCSNLTPETRGQTFFSKPLMLLLCDISLKRHLLIKRTIGQLRHQIHGQIQPGHVRLRHQIAYQVGFNGLS